tara:strand:- start:122869 stop:123348 length:480 start_codon:yes stop_codon:yes gene_type:complete
VWGIGFRGLLLIEGTSGIVTDPLGAFCVRVRQQVCVRTAFVEQHLQDGLIINGIVWAGKQFEAHQKWQQAGQQQADAGNCGRDDRSAPAFVGDLFSLGFEPVALMIDLGPLRLDVTLQADDFSPRGSISFDKCSGTVRDVFLQLSHSQGLLSLQSRVFL